ncbi:hypothetical protein TNCV_4921501 [Trichonephila clavipes]|nr:hypothetical protein TNCV_4921501 [Trichonephila clavipes]
MDAGSEKLRGSFPIGSYTLLAKSSANKVYIVLRKWRANQSRSAIQQSWIAGQRCWDILDGWVDMPINFTKEVGSEFANRLSNS